VVKGKVERADADSYILTNTQKEELVSNFNRFRIEKGSDYKTIKGCVDTITKTNKCEWYNKCGEPGRIEDPEELYELEDNEIPYLDLVSRAPIESDDVYILNGRCYSREGLKHWFSTFQDKISKARDPATNAEIELETIVELGLNPADFRHTYKKEMPKEPMPEELKDLQDMLVREGRISEDEDIRDLDELSMKNLNLKEIPKGLKYLDNLEFLNLNNNPITQIENLPDSLFELWLNNTSVNKIELGSLPSSLEDLHLNNTPINKIENLPSDLLKLYLSNTSVNEIEPGSLPSSLESLSLGNNNITKIKPGVFPNSLIELDLQRNKIQKIEPGTFPNSLVKLDLHENEIEELTEKDVFPNSLKELYLNDNKIRELKKGVLPDSIETITLEGNKINPVPYNYFSDDWEFGGWN
jgi:hypothetical protein